MLRTLSRSPSAPPTFQKITSASSAAAEENSRRPIPKSPGDPRHRQVDAPHIVETDFVGLLGNDPEIRADAVIGDRVSPPRAIDVDRDHQHERHPRRHRGHDQRRHRDRQRKNERRPRARQKQDHEQPTSKVMPLGNRAFPDDLLVGGSRGRIHGPGAYRTRRPNATRKRGRSLSLRKPADGARGPVSVPRRLAGWRSVSGRSRGEKQRGGAKGHALLYGTGLARAPQSRRNIARRSRGGTGVGRAMQGMNGRVLRITAPKETGRWLAANTIN